MTIFFQFKALYSLLSQILSGLVALPIIVLPSTPFPNSNVPSSLLLLYCVISHVEHMEHHIT